MGLVALVFETPRGALVALSVLLPLVAAVVAVRRSLRVAELLGLMPARGRSLGLPAAGAAAVCVLLAFAAARPELSGSSEPPVRSDSQVVFVVDVSRSMLASQRAGGETRLDRAKRVVQTLRDAVPRVPAGLTGLTDRVLPFTFPTTDAATFSETLRRSVLVENPPPRDVAVVATTFAALRPLDRDGFFDADVSRRTCVVVTDGETRPIAAGALRRSGARRCALIAVRVGSRTDRVHGEDGLPEIGYRADPAAGENVARLADSRGGSAWEAGDLDGAVGALRSAADAGPTVRAQTTPQGRSLAPFFAGAAFLVAAALTAAALQSAGLLSGPWGSRHHRPAP